MRANTGLGGAGCIPGYPAEAGGLQVQSLPGSQRGSKDGVHTPVRPLQSKE